MRFGRTPPAVFAAACVAAALFGCTALVGVGEYRSGSADAATWSTDDASSPIGDAAKGPPGEAGAVDTGAPPPPPSDGGACPTPLCGGSCCAAGEVCLTNNGFSGCVKQCANNFTQTATCGGLTPCCMEQMTETDAGSVWNGQGACTAEPAQPNDGQCLCTTSAECPSGACTPVLGHYTCQPNDAKLGHGCSEDCGSCYDCVVDCNGNHWCAWSYSAGCSAEACPAGFCIVSSPTCDNLLYACADDCMLCSCQ